MIFFGQSLKVFFQHRFVLGQHNVAGGTGKFVAEPRRQIPPTFLQRVGGRATIAKLRVRFCNWSELSFGKVVAGAWPAVVPALLPDEDFEDIFAFPRFASSFALRRELQKLVEDLPLHVGGLAIHLPVA